MFIIVQMSSIGNFFKCFPHNLSTLPLATQTLNYSMYTPLEKKKKRNDGSGNPCVHQCTCAKVGFSYLT